MKTYGGVEVYIHAFLSSAIDGGELSASRPGRFTPEEIPPPPYSLDRRLGGPQSHSFYTEPKIIQFRECLKWKSRILIRVILYVMCHIFVRRDILENCGYFGPIRIKIRVT
jgi:hypothetical protein